MQKYSPHPHSGGEGACLPVPRGYAVCARRAGWALDLPRGVARGPPRGFCAGRPRAEPRTRKRPEPRRNRRGGGSAANCILNLIFFCAGLPPHFGREAKKKFPPAAKKNQAGAFTTFLFCGGVSLDNTAKCSG